MSDALGDAVVAELARPEAYRDDPSAGDRIGWVQTHLSHVFLTGERVYKLRKPVDLDFVRFPTRAERNADCLREVALNRRLAPDVYLGVAPIELGPEGARLGRVAEALAVGDAGGVPEHVVVMRRLPEGRDALSLLQQGLLTRAQLDRFTLKLAAFHDRHGLGAPSPFGPEAWREICTGPLAESLALLEVAPRELVPRPLLARLQEASRCFAAERAERFERRRRLGRAVEAHGDLHLQHLWFETDDAEPLVIDCLEFNESLRRIDVAAEVAFTAMDLAYRGRAELGEHFLAVYAEARDDFDLYGVVDYFQAYRAVVRAKVASLAARDAGIDAAQRAAAIGSTGSHLDLAARMLEPRPPGALVLLGGVVGTGKSTAARELARRLEVPVIASDQVRKRLPDLAHARGGSDNVDTGLYSPELRRRVYSEVLLRAQAVIGSGRTVILDATWSTAREREAAGELARRFGARLVFVETRCSADEARRRLRRRQAQGSDASDAGEAFHATSAARFEPWSDAESGCHHVLATDSVDWERGLDPLVDSLSRQ